MGHEETGGTGGSVLMFARVEDGSESGVEELIFHVKAACGTQERLAGAVCALTFQAFR